MDEKKITPLSTSSDEILEAIAAIGARAPWLSEPIFPILLKLTIPHNFGRVRSVLLEMAQQLKNIQPEDAARYLKTDDFYVLFQEALEYSANEPDDQKRKCYAYFLASDLKLPHQPYMEKMNLLHDLEELPPDGVRLLKSLLREPEGRVYIPLYQTLQQRLPDLAMERIAELTGQLEGRGIANFKNQTALLRGRRPGDLQVLITRYGQRLLSYILPGG
ncbi:MAG: hypothetical protein P4L50_15875 [Anaerolineaceae bacterium]|nr:hypothetical protein [Anaerolineaceae bacterium]